MLMNRRNNIIALLKEIADNFPDCNLSTTLVGLGASNVTLCGHTILATFDDEEVALPLSQIIDLSE